MTNQKTIKKLFSKTDLIKKFIEQNNFLFLLILLLLISFFVFKDFLLFKNLYLFKDIGSDTINLFYPNLVLIADYIHQFQLPKWSFSQGMGQNIFPFSLGDPFNWILYILGRGNLPYAIVYIELLKIILGGYIFYKYLRIITISKYSSIIGGILFAFSGFMILGGGWYAYSTEAVLGVLLLYSFERLFLKKSWPLFTVAIALICGMHPFNLYLYGSFLITYVIFRILEEGNLNFNYLSRLILKLISISFLGIAISSVFFISDVIQVWESPRISGGFSYFELLSDRSVFAIGSLQHNFTAIMRLFSSDLIGSGSHFHGWHNYLESPIFYCGLISLLLFPQIFILVNTRKKIIYGAFLLFWALPIIFPYFRYSYWLFTGDYYRALSFHLMIVLLLFSLKTLSTNKINLTLLFITLAILIFALFYPYFTDVSNCINQELRNIIALFLIVYTALLWLIKYPRLLFLSKVLLIITISFEMAYFSSITVNSRSIITKNEFRQKVGYNDFTIEAISYLKSIDKSFYRINKDYYSGSSIHSSLNDAKIQGYYGTTSFYAFNQPFYIKFLEENAIIDPQNEGHSRWALGFSTRPELQTFGSVKYNLSKNINPHMLNMGYDLIAGFGNVKVMQNKYFLPLGFTYEYFITLDEFRKLSDKQKKITLFRAFVCDNIEDMNYNEMEVYVNKNRIFNYTWEEHKMAIDERRKDTLNIIEHNDNLIRGDIQLDKKKMLFFSIPYDKGWKATVDGEAAKLKIVNIGFMGLILEKGMHTVILKYTPPYLLISTIISIVSIIIFCLLIVNFHLSKRKSKIENLTQ